MIVFRALRARTHLADSLRRDHLFVKRAMCGKTKDRVREQNKTTCCFCITISGRFKQNILTDVTDETQAVYNQTSFHLHIYLQIRVIWLFMCTVILNERLHPRTARSEPQQSKIEAEGAIGGNVGCQAVFSVCWKKELLTCALNHNCLLHDDVLKK